MHTTIDDLDIQYFDFMIKKIRETRNEAEEVHRDYWVNALEEFIDFFKKKPLSNHWAELDNDSNL